MTRLMAIPLCCTPWRLRLRKVLVIADLLLILLLLSTSGIVKEVDAADCTVATLPAASDIRSRAMYIAIQTPDLPVSSVTKAMFIISQGGTLTISSVSSYTAEAPYELGITLAQLTTFAPFQNVSLTVSIDKSAFAVADSGCTVVIVIVPSAGSISLANVPTTFFETDINAGNISMVLSVENDVFNDTAVAITPLPLPFGLQCVVTLLPNSVTNLSLVILQNTSLNIPLSSSSRSFRVAFPKSIMRTGLSPLVGTLQVDYFDVTLSPSQPSVKVVYPLDGTNSIPSEALWDGVGAVQLVLLGDVWKPNATMWTNSVTQPVAVPLPFQKQGYDFLVNQSTTNVTFITDRIAQLTWSRCFGFGVTTLQIVTLSAWGHLTQEGQGSIEFTVNIRPATAASISVSFAASVPLAQQSLATATATGVAFAGNMTELHIRKFGLNVTLIAYHDVLSPSLDVTTLKAALSSASGAWSKDGLSFSLVNGSAVQIVIPPQLSYNIDTADTLALQATASVLGSGSTITASVLQLAVATVPTPICSYPSGYVINAAMIRDGNTTFDITVTNDTVCSTDTVTSAVIPAISEARGLLQFSINASYTNQVNPSKIQFVIQQTPTFAISSPDSVTIPFVASIFCSLEVCQVPTNQNNPNAVAFTIRPSAGTLRIQMPTVTELVPRSTDLVVSFVLVGDIFTQSRFTPTLTPNTSSQDRMRGFAASFTANKRCVVDVNAANASMATLTCTANQTYDISVPEATFLTVPKSVVSSQQSPDSVSQATPFIVTPVAGLLVSSVAQTTTLTEASVIQGALVMNFTLVYERWRTVDTIGAQLRSAFPAQTTLNSSFSTVAFLSTFLAANTLSVVNNQQTLLWRTPPLPDYDIRFVEIFSLLFSNDSVLFGLQDGCTNVTFVVQPSTSYFTATGTALYFGVRDLLSTPLFYNLTLRFDLWVATAVYDTNSLCPMTRCVASVDTSRRVLTVSLDPNPDYVTATAVSFPFVMRTGYTDSGVLPLNVNNSVMSVYVTPGLLTWSGPTQVTEGQLRGVSSTSLVWIATIQGDVFSSPADVLRGLLSATTCENRNGSSVDATSGFCGRLSALLPVSSVSVQQSGRVAVMVVQGDPTGLDIAYPQFITLRLSGIAVQSRITPWNTLSVVATPTSGTYFISGIPTDLTARDVTGGPGARSVHLRIRVDGDRFLRANAGGAAIAAIVMFLQVTSSAASSSSMSQQTGFAALAASIFTADAAFISDDGHELTVALTPNSAYFADSDESVTLLLPGAALMSGKNATPSLGIAAVTFKIAATAAAIYVSPASVTASSVRAGTIVLNLIVSSAGTWNQAYVQSGPNLVAAVSCGGTSVDEPFGCRRHVTTMLSKVAAVGASINGSSLVIPLVAAPTFDVRNGDVLRFTLSLNWTTALLPVVPSVMEISITPDPPTVVAVVVLSLVRNRNNSLVWRTQNGTEVRPVPPALVDNASCAQAIARWLSVPAAAVEIVSGEIESRLSGSWTDGTTGDTVATFATVSFRVRNMYTPSPYYDADAAASFGNMVAATPIHTLLSSSSSVATAPSAGSVRWLSDLAVAPGTALWQTRIRVLNQVAYAYLSTESPPSYIWTFLATGTVPVDNSYHYPLNAFQTFIIVVVVVAFVASVVAIVFLYHRRRTQGGLMRADASKQTKYMVDEVDEAAGPEDEVVGLNMAQWAAEEGDDSAAFAGQPKPALRLGAEVLDTVRREPDVPILLYSGQRNPDTKLLAEEERRRATMERVANVEAFLVEGGYKKPQRRDDDDTTVSGAAGAPPPPPRRLHYITKEEAKLQHAAVLAGLATTFKKEGDTVEEGDVDDADPFSHVVYPVSQHHRLLNRGLNSGNGAAGHHCGFQPPSKFRSDWNSL